MRDGSCQLVVGQQLDIGYLTCGDQIATETTDAWFLNKLHTTNKLTNSTYKTKIEPTLALFYFGCAFSNRIDSKTDLTSPSPPHLPKKKKYTKKNTKKSKTIPLANQNL